MRQLLDAQPVFGLELDPDVELVALVAELRGHPAEDVVLDGVGHLAAVEAEFGQAGAIDPQGPLELAGLAVDPGVDDSGDRRHRGDHALGEFVALVQVVAADLDHQPRVLAAAHHAHHHVAGRGVELDPGRRDIGDGVADRREDLLLAAAPIGQRGEQNLHRALVGLGRPPPALGTGGGDQAVEFVGPERAADPVFDLLHRSGGRVERRADRHLDLHVQAAFVALGHQFESDHGNQSQ